MPNFSILQKAFDEDQTKFEEIVKQYEESIKKSKSLRIEDVPEKFTFTFASVSRFKKFIDAHFTR